MPKRSTHGSAESPASSVSVARAAGGAGWALVHPRCARECADDLDEVRAMIAAGEYDVAIDELRWLLEVCRDLLEGHFLLGKLAVEHQQDVPLARGHFGYAYQLGDKALTRVKNPSGLSALHPANRPFYDAGRGLAWCLAELGQPDKAREVIERLLACDPTDPLGLRAWLDELGTGGLPIVELG
jgi:tetratricopeptide (TPR) repeat protein